MKTDVWFTRRENGRTVHNFVSNFYIEPDGTCVESEFQAEKFRLCGKPFTAIAIEGMRPGRAKQWGRRRLEMDKRQRALWERHKREIMRELVSMKFNDHAELRQQLLDTGTGRIVEENWWHDDEWGNCVCRDHFWRIGKNLLGEILMEVRQEHGGEPPIRRSPWR